MPYADDEMHEPAFAPPVTRYARSGGFRIAYQTLGSGERDVVFVPWFQLFAVQGAVQG